ncbi:protein pigeon isoform X2 [Bacillus rossius redtenbacheri]|uniref:protein pigeon isoform X2 n=1 Tax=Bacillus rossius redtenbacheri TaxID=93214 RepID=UPI002FDEECB5
MVENLKGKLGALFQNESNNFKGDATDWRLLGQERDGLLLVGWTLSADHTARTCIGAFDYASNCLQVLHVLDSLVHVVQASVSHSRQLLGYVVKEVKEEEAYRACLAQLGPHGATEQPLGARSTHQTLVQFLYRRKDRSAAEKLVHLVHQEHIVLQQLTRVETEDGNWEPGDAESLVQAFTWAQWDPEHQCLYYIHYRRAAASVEGEGGEEVAPTLTCLQFHDHLPHETVLNIPLNLPQLPRAGEALCALYEDDPIPLRAHNCSLDLQVVCDSTGVVCICHHYLYQPFRSPQEAAREADATSTVHFAYSVTLLHHGCVIHCVMPGIPWARARAMKPTFALHGDHHLVVYAPGLFTHLLDVGLSHEPCCHVLLSPVLAGVPASACRLVPLLGPAGEGPLLTVDLGSLDLVPLAVGGGHLADAFRHASSLDNRLAILHYFLVHRHDADMVAELLMPLAERPLDLSAARLLQEALVGGAYASVLRSLPSDAAALVALLPFSTVVAAPELQVKADKQSVSVTQQTLWNTAMMLLSPGQRLVPYRADMWTQLWEHLARHGGKEHARFQPSQVADKLMVSLVCYQPEALSRSSTPLSPGTSLVGSGALADLASLAGRKASADALPFPEVESCTASKQEHVISVNLRELSMHLLKGAAGRQTPMHVHVVATRYVSAQLETSRLLCQLLCRSAAVDARLQQERGFPLVDQLDEGRRLVLFHLLERYHYAVGSLAFPLPQGFTSFFTYLGYRALPRPAFLQYLQRSVLELHVDALKAIFADVEDSREGVRWKLRLLLQLPRSRAKRLLNQWAHPVSLMLRAREHALAVLSGLEGTQAARARPAAPRSRPAPLYSRGLAAFPSADRLSPLDTFLDLLTAKASLTELDFGLLVEATITSTEDFL